MNACCKVPLPKFVGTVTASWKEVKEVKKVTLSSCLKWEGGGRPREWAVQRPRGEREDSASDNKKHVSTIRVSCLGIWNKTLELEEVF